MAIVDMTRFTLFSFREDKEALLKELQKFNYVHFLEREEDLSPKAEEKAPSARVPERVVAVNEDVERVKYAIRLLFNYDPRPKGLRGLREGHPTISFAELEGAAKSSGWETIYEKVREISDRLDDLKLKETKLRGELEEAESWRDLDVSPKSLEKLSGAQALLGSIPRKMEANLVGTLAQKNLVYLEKVGENKSDFFYLVLFHPSVEEEVTEVLRSAAFSQMKLDFDEESLARRQRLYQEIVALKALENKTKEELRTYGADLPKLELAYEYLVNQQMRVMSEEHFLTTEYVDVIEGYYPTEKAAEFQAAVEQGVGERYYLQSEAAQREAKDVPIILKNNKFNKAFENITEMYAMPRYNEIDPTPLLAPFYMIFFGMMLGDAGYGLILLLGSWAALKYLKLSKSMRGFVQFFFYLSIPTIFWGIVYGSYLALDIPVPKLLDLNKDFTTLLILAVAIGLVHLFFGLAVKAYMLIRDGKPMDAVFDVGFWYMALTGLLLLLGSGPLGLAPIVPAIAKWVMIAGMVGIVLFGARSAAGWGGRIAGGLYSLYGISSWVGDIVSYSRLMALGLSSAFIGMAFNMIAGMVGGAWYLLPFAAVIFVAGHFFNLFLSALGAYVHSLRLIYVEFFGKFYEGSGKRFKKMKAEPKYLNYSEEESY
ncbi:V-type ATP synthase subunit I [Clostridiaceae bacterium JG1575]|nr:V-type ATP synthase subunit I [Clostridiaceae bacterium JG1575]